MAAGSTVGTSADGANQHRNQHCGGDALAGDIADHDEQRAVGVGNDLEEVAAEDPAPGQEKTLSRHGPQTST
jgi:hypothetical protein